LALVVVVGVVVISAVPGVIGMDESLVVRSDSMSPAIGAGSVVYVNDVSASAISTGDVITYRGEPGRAERVTHRVVAVEAENGERRFRTKGDANEEPDPEPVSPARIVGRVSFHVPYVGYVVAFAQTGPGLALLVIVPALLLIVTELRDLLRAARGDENSDDGSTGDPP
jgi:signal peptidase